MRGKLYGASRREKKRWNIPAYAGKTIADFEIWLCTTEHPRVCGENVPAAANPPVAAGTSPRMRGKPTPGRRLVSTRRNIPAYAGKTQGK